MDSPDVIDQTLFGEISSSTIGACERLHRKGLNPVNKSLFGNSILLVYKSVVLASPQSLTIMLSKPYGSKNSLKVLKNVFRVAL